MDRLDLWFAIQPYVIALGIGGIIAYMFFIIFKVGRESGVGRLGMIILFIVLGAGMAGFVAKHVIMYLLGI